MELSSIYSTCRHELLELAPSLEPEALGVALAATPPWTVLDGYRHLTGVCCDFLDGVMEGAGTPQWTAAQLASRSGCSIGEVCAEWAERGPEVDERIAQADASLSFLAFDVWTHAQDIRSAAGGCNVRDGEMVDAIARLALSTLARRYVSKGGPTLRVALDDHEAVLGDGPALITLETTPYEALRIVFGRRSRRQVESAAWSGDGVDAAIEAIHLFDFPPVDISD